MSTITTVVKNGYAAIAADTLSKRGYHKEGAGYVKGNQKILCIQGNFIAIVGPTSTKLIIKDTCPAWRAICNWRVWRASSRPGGSYMRRSKTAIS